MNISRSVRRLAGLIAGAALACSITGTALAQDLSIRFAWYMPPHTATAAQGNAIAANIEQMSGGKIKVATYPSGSLLKESNMAQGISNNTVNMGIMAMHWWSNQEPALEWDTIPFLVNDAGHLLKALHGPLGADINKILNKHNVEIIGWGFYGYAKSYVNSKQAVKLPADLKGLRMRSEGKLSAQFLKSQGATPVAVDSSEVYTALQRGSLDGAVSGLSSIVSRKWYEVGNYITAIHYVPLVYPVQANRHWWEGLSAQQRAVISKAIAATEQANVDAIEKEFKRDIAVATQHGDTVYQPDAATLKKWQAAAQPLEEKQYLKQAGATGKKLLNDVRQALAN